MALPSESFEFHYLLQGSLRFAVGDREYAIPNGDVFVAFPNELNKTGEQNVVRQLYWFSVEDTDTILGLGSEWSNLLMDGLRGLQIRVIPVGNETKDLLKEVFQNITSSDEGHRMYASLQMATVLYKLIEYDRQWLERSVSNEISLALDFIDQNKKEIFRWRRRPGTAICRCLISSCASSAKPAARQLFTFKTAHGRRQRDAQGWSFGYRYGA